MTLFRDHNLRNYSQMSNHWQLFELTERSTKLGNRELYSVCTIMNEFTDDSQVHESRNNRH